MTINLEAARAERMRLLRWLSKRQSAKVQRLEQRVAALELALEPHDPDHPALSQVGDE